MDPKTLKIAKNVGRPGVLLSLAWRSEADHVFYGCSDAKVYDLDLADEKAKPAEMSGHQSYVTGLALAGDLLVSGGYDGKLIWWNAQTHEKVREADAHSRWIRGVVASPDGKTVASVADDMVCRLWEAESGKLLHELKGHDEHTPNHYPSMLYACAISHDGKLVATGDRVGHVVVWELATGKQLATLETPVMYTWDPEGAPAFHWRHSQPVVLPRWQVAGRRRHGKGRQYRPPARPGADRSLRLGRRKTHARNRQR